MAASPYAQFNPALKAALYSPELFSLVEKQGTWLAGGCLLLAQALRGWLGGDAQLIGLYIGGGLLQHVGVETMNAVIDGDGAIATTRWARRYARLEHIDVPARSGPVESAYAAREFKVRLSRAKVDRLTRLLRERLGPPSCWSPLL